MESNETLVCTCVEVRARDYVLPIKYIEGDILVYVSSNILSISYILGKFYIFYLSWILQHPVIAVSEYCEIMSISFFFQRQQVDSIILEFSYHPMLKGCLRDVAI